MNLKSPTKRHLIPCFTPSVVGLAERLLPSPRITHRQVQLFRAPVGLITRTRLCRRIAPHRNIPLSQEKATVYHVKDRDAAKSTGVQVADLVSHACNTQLSYSSSLFMHVSGTSIEGIHCSNFKTRTQSFGARQCHVQL